MSPSWSLTISEQTVALAKRSEALGYDLVTFQDHPYQNEFRDNFNIASLEATD